MERSLRYATEGLRNAKELTRMRGERYDVARDVNVPSDVLSERPRARKLSTIYTIVLLRHIYTFRLTIDTIVDICVREDGSGLNRATFEIRDCEDANVVILSWCPACEFRFARYRRSI